ncbi:DMT family transporter [Curvibacter sp. APW13]|uniref:DMT family transporter n=1 Tax=Curvibacter sp. APW13 TaxID=3077236 RepID=UPI0028DF1DBE|nr:DMT family transporter [Curvibacter sp. APW13]MDT8992268.1 DMT family transporter [Curvibacter sp. APW13]
MNAAAQGSEPVRYRLAVLALWGAPVLWTVNLIIARKAPGLVDPYTLAFGRWLIAAVVLVALSWQELWGKRAEVLRQWRHFVVLGFCGMLVCGAWVYLGAQSTVAMNIALIYAASPVLIGLGAVLWLGERMRPTQVAGVVLAMAGVVHVVVQGRWTALAQVQWVAGDWWIVAAMVAWAAYALLQKLWPSSLGDSARLAAISLGGVLTLLPGMVWEQMSATHLPVTAEALAIMALAALVPGVGAYWIYGWAQKILGASRVAVTLYLGPLYAAVAAYAVLGESLGWQHIGGAALILPGVWLVSRR